MLFQVLSETVNNVLKKTDKRKMASVAIPAISAGVFGYPVDLSCENIVETLDNYIKVYTIVIFLL